jgi:hypothetical protein
VTELEQRPASFFDSTLLHQNLRPHELRHFALFHGALARQLEQRIVGAIEIALAQTTGDFLPTLPCGRFRHR